MAELVCIVRDKDGHVLSDEELSNKVIDSDLYYRLMATVIRRMEEEE